jgi:DDE superfamily endonuclease
MRQWRAAGEEFVEQGAQIVDVRARVHIQGVERRLFRTHVLQRADNAAETGNQRPLGQPLPQRFRQSMERRFAARMQEALDGAVVDPRVFRDVQPRLENFLEPFVALLRETEQKEHAPRYVIGLLSDLKRKTVESVAYLHDQERLPFLQKFIGCSPWEHRPLLWELACQVGAELGEADGVIVFDPSAHPKKGTESVGVQRQWCGRLGKIENCQEFT